MARAVMPERVQATMATAFSSIAARHAAPVMAAAVTRWERRADADLLYAEAPPPTLVVEGLLGASHDAVHGRSPSPTGSSPIAVSPLRA